MQTTLEKIKKTRAAGIIAAPEPLPKEKGFMVQRCLLDGVPITAKFDQQPPAGSQMVPPDNKWLGYLLFLDTQGEIWKVPDMWYNRTWADRLESFKISKDRIQERIAYEKDTIARIKKTPHPTKEEKREASNATFLLRQQENTLAELEKAEAHIRKHAKMDGYPCLHPIPKEME